TITSLFSFLLLFFNATAPTEIYTLSLHDALPISGAMHEPPGRGIAGCAGRIERDAITPLQKTLSGNVSALEAGYGIRQRDEGDRSEEHTSELQSPYDLVCRLLLEKKKKIHSTKIK